MRNDPTMAQVSPSCRLQELNGAKVHHLLEYLDKAAIAALEVAHAASAASPLPSAAESTISPSSSAMRDDSALFLSDGDNGVPTEKGSAAVYEEGKLHHTVGAASISQHQTSQELSSANALPDISIRGGGAASGSMAMQTSLLSGGCSSSSVSIPLVAHRGITPLPDRNDAASHTSSCFSLSSFSGDAVSAAHPTWEGRIAETAIPAGGRPRDGKPGRRAAHSHHATHHSTSSSTSSNHLQHIFFELQDKMDRLRYEGKVLQNEKDLLLEQLEQSKQREADIRHSSRKEAQEEVTRVKREIKQTISAQEKAIEGLQIEKRGLEKKLEQLSRELRDVMANQEEERKRIEAAHTTALSLLQSKYMAKERSEREKWREQESRKIKASTLQSLEPDIVMLLQRHKAEKLRMEEEWSSVIRDKERKIKELGETLERKVETIQREGEEKIAKLQHAHAQEETRIKEEMEARLKKEIAQRIAETEKGAGFEKEALKADLEREFHAARVKEQERNEEDLRHWKEEVQRLRTQYNQELIQATQLAHHEEEVKRLSWQEMFTKRTEEEVQLRCSREFQQQVREMEATLHQKYLTERDAAVEAVLTTLQKEHEEEQEKHRRERQQEGKQIQQLQRDLESMREEKENYRQQLLVSTAERERLFLQYQEVCEVNRRYQMKEKMMMEKVDAKGRLEQEILRAELERQEQELQTKHASERSLLESQYKEKERRQQQEVQELIEEKRNLVQQHHEELRQIQGRVMETMRAKEAALSELQQRVQQLQQELRNQENWAIQQKQFLLHR